METNCLADEYDHIDKSLEYVLENVLSQETIESTKNESFKLRELYNTLLANVCKCEEGSDCSSCVHGSYVLEGNTDEYVLRQLNGTDLIYECSSLCKCNLELCHNRAVQRGPRKYLEVIESHKYMSKGVVTTMDIPKGAFICEYVGELLTYSEAKRRQYENEKNHKMNYVLCLKEYCSEDCSSKVDVAKELTTIVDPSQKGNIGRYLNHSCEPNCQIFSVRVDSPIPKIAIFSKRFISAGEELCFHYNEGMRGDSENHTENRIPCLCGSENCITYLPNVEM